ncbi:MAG: hypothetical protein LCH91_15645 [Bacteroidetes bacterium]|nr:hypothetical protein [Bacteroidota bacterium]
MQYFPDNIVRVEYVLATLDNYKGQPENILVAVRQEAIQKLGELAISISQEIQRVADRYQITFNRSQLLTSIATITGSLTTIVSSAIPTNPSGDNQDVDAAKKAQAKVQIVNTVGTVLTVLSGALAAVSSRNSIKAQTELQTLQLKLQQVQNAIASIQQNQSGTDTSSSSKLLIGGIILALILVASRRN